jgi:DNA-binding response OmpR family regulator
MAGKVLIVDSDNVFANSLKYSLEKDRYKIDIINTGRDISNRIKSNNYKLVLLEPESKGIEGVAICKKIREFSNIPLIIISQNDEDMNKILALEYGADDYLVKPINVLELKARVKSLFRRINSNNEENDKYYYKFDDFTIDAIKQLVQYKNVDLNLTRKEFELFYVLSLNPGKVFTRKELLKRIWGYEYYGDLRTVDVHIRRIREKLQKEGALEYQYISTKWGVGYYFQLPK